MCLCDLLGCTILFIVALIIQAVVFVGFTVIAFAFALIVTLIIKYNQGSTGPINYKIWAVCSFVILSYISQRFALEYSRSHIKVWFDRKKQMYPNVIIKFCHMILILTYFAMFLVALNEMFLNHPLQIQNRKFILLNKSHTKTIITVTSESGPEEEIKTGKKNFSYIFLLSMSYTVYMVAASSDWIKYLSLLVQKQIFGFGCLVNGTACLVSEILSILINPFLLLAFTVPLIVEFYGSSPRWIFYSGIGASTGALALNLDDACSCLGGYFGSRNLLSDFANTLWAKNFILHHLWFPLVVYWYMKDWKAILFSHQLNDREDFAFWVSLFSIALFKCVRNVTFKDPAEVDLPRFRNDQVHAVVADAGTVTDEPVGEGDNYRRKIPVLVSLTQPQIAQETDFITGSGIETRSRLPSKWNGNIGVNINREDVNNNNNNTHTYLGMHYASELPQISPSAPPRIELSESENSDSAPPTYSEISFRIGKS